MSGTGQPQKHFLRAINGFGSDSATGLSSWTASREDPHEVGVGPHQPGGGTAKVAIPRPERPVPERRPSGAVRRPGEWTNGRGADAIVRLQALATRVGFPVTLA